MKKIALMTTLAMMLSMAAMAADSATAPVVPVQQDAKAKKEVVKKDVKKVLVAKKIVKKDEKKVVDPTATEAKTK